MTSLPLPTDSSPDAIQAPGIEALLLGLAGGALLLARPRLPRHTRSAAVVAGLALLGAATRRPIGNRIRAAGADRRSAEVRLSFRIAQPVERVFAFCRDFENFPLVVGALREVRDYGDGRSHWCASTPAGRRVEWDTMITKYVPNSVIGWQSVGSSSVKSSGLIRVKPESSGTCMEVTLSYRVLHSRLRDSLAALVTQPVAAQLRRDVERLASYLESTEAPAPAEVHPD